MVEWITNTMSSLGYLGIGLLMFAENLFPHSFGTDYAVGGIYGSEGRNELRAGSSSGSGGYCTRGIAVVLRRQIRERATQKLSR